MYSVLRDREKRRYDVTDPTSLLPLAAGREDQQFIKALISDGADVHAIDAMFKAVLCKTGESIKTLVSYGAQVDVKDSLGRTPLVEAVLRRKLFSIRALILAGADLNCRTESGETLFDLCYYVDRSDIERVIKQTRAELIPNLTNCLSVN